MVGRLGVPPLCGRPPATALLPFVLAAGAVLVLQAGQALDGVDPRLALQQAREAGGGAQGLVEGAGFEVGVGGDDHEHGGEARREHARTLGHSADGVAGAGNLNEFRNRVGGHDGHGRAVTGIR